MVKDGHSPTIILWRKEGKVQEAVPQFKSDTSVLKNLQTEAQLI
jgi:hypothetical protein